MASIFTKIIEREIPADIVYEDDTVIAFLDINPVNPGHTLVVPKTEYANFSAIPSEKLGAYFERVQLVARAVLEGTGADGYNLMFNTGEAAGQDVFHVHAHIIPRFEGDGFEHWTSTPYPNDEAKRSAAETIRGAFTRGA